MAQWKDADARRKVVGTRSSLLMQEYFFGPLALKMDLVEDPNAKKMWTDMKSLGYNPEWVKEASRDELKARICEITMHNANGHSWRGQGRDPKTWNRACDYALWNILAQAGFALPEDVLYDPQYAGLSAETIYDRIWQAPEQGDFPRPSDEPGGSGGQPPPPDPRDQGDDQRDDQPDPPNDQPKPRDGDPGSGGEVRPPPTDQGQQLRDDWKIAVLQAAHIAKQRGKLPAGIAALVEQIENPAVDWKAITRRFVEQSAREDYSWSRPSRRYLPRGLFMPHIKSDHMPPIGFLWDTSGSRNSKEARARAAAELAEVFYEARPEKLYVIYIDAEVQRVEVFEPGDTIKFNPKGGGGTDFCPAFDWIAAGEDADTKGNPDLKPFDLPICCLIGITDAYAEFPEEAPPYPVMWVVDTGAPVPWGELLRINP